MIIFYEGLPRSGKSLSALKEYGVPMLKKGREVFAYIAGLDHEKIAVLAGITIERCRELLHPLTKEQVKEIYKHVKPNAFVILDELQNFWPKSRKPCDEAITEFVSEHGHMGLDILTMGQNINDCHALWTNRMAQKNFYLKLEAKGKPDMFRCTIFKPVRKGDKLVWQEVQTLPDAFYDTDYFGAYSSHTEDTTNKETLIDQRANIWNSPILKKWLPLYGIVLVVAVLFIGYLFEGGGLAKSIDNKGVSTKESPVVPHPAAVTTTVEHVPAPEKSANPLPLGQQATQQKTPVSYEETIIPDDPPDVIDDLSQKARIRLSGFIKMGSRASGYIEWRNDSYDVIERMSFDDLKVMGWIVLVNQDSTLAIVQKYHKRYIATSWPMPEPKGMLTDKQVEGIKPQNVSYQQVSYKDAAGINAPVSPSP